jgi:hypothetical protein
VIDHTSLGGESGEDPAQIEVSVLGRRYSDRELARLVGAPDGALVQVQYVRRGAGVEQVAVEIRVKHPWYRSKPFYALSRGPDGRPMMYIAETRRDPAVRVESPSPTTGTPRDRVPGLGQTSRLHAIAMARAEGLTAIDINAGGPDQGQIGTKIWPLLGFDGPIPKPYLDALPMRLRQPLPLRAPQLSDLAHSPAGRQHLRAHPPGTLLGLRFDLDLDSGSSRVLRRYHREQGLRLTRSYVRHVRSLAKARGTAVSVSQGPPAEAEPIRQTRVPTPTRPRS